MTSSILTFHTLDDQKSVLSFSPSFFHESIAKLHEKGYTTIGLAQMTQWLNHGIAPLDRSIVITFDDGYQSVYEKAFPILLKHEMTATVFLATGNVLALRSTDRLPSQDGRVMLSWDEIREMHRAGIHFGAHTLTHRDLTRLPPDQIEQEMRESKEIIEQQIGSSVACFAYPFGRYDARCRAIAQQYFSCACSDRLGLIHAQSDAYALERIDTFYLRTKRSFDLLFNRFFPAYIGALGIPRNLRRTISRTLTLGI